MPRQTKERAEQTRIEILDAAGRVFYERGVGRASLEEIAQEAGVTRGAVYWHFKDKLDLFLALTDDAPLLYEELLCEFSVNAHGDLLAALESSILRALRAITKDTARQRQLTVLMLRCDYVEELAPVLQRHARIYESFAKDLGMIFDQIALRVSPPPVWKAADAAQALQTLLYGAFLSWLRYPDQFPLGTSGVRTVKALFAVLRA